jgi:cytidine deaminase
MNETSDLSTPDVGTLIQLARDVSNNAHAPYSGFGVGAAVLLDDGEVITGCNFENASTGLTLCAETVALASVNVAGRIKAVRAIAVAGGPISAARISGTALVYPCGRCRQIIHEAAQLSKFDIPVHCASAEGEGHETHLISALLPHAFGPADLGMA